MIRWLMLGSLAMSGCAHRFVECHSTETCRAQAAERDRAFARLVAEEPLGRRLEVEAVSAQVLADRSLVYAIDPQLVALDRETGAQRWRVAQVQATDLWRVGSWLVLRHATARATLSFVSPNAPTNLLTCALDLPAPAHANAFTLHPFDRDGEAYVFWSSSLDLGDMGTRPSEEQERSAEAAEACGVVQLDPRTCATSPLPLRRFVWDPPEGRRSGLDDRRGCIMLSALRDLPAAAAAAPHPLSPPAPIALTVAVSTDRQPCLDTTHFTLQARAPDSTLLWSHSLADRISHCPPP